jgi:hypothetical protein
VLFIYTTNISTRLQYILAELFKNEYTLTNNIEQYLAHNGPCINYSANAIKALELKIVPHPLLQEKSIRNQDTECFDWNGNPVFFKTNNGAIPFDIFSASFYLLSRYEEYLPHSVDEYGRYSHTNSLAYKNNFLHLPLIHLWMQQLAIQLQQLTVSYALPSATFSFTPTYDIDIAYAYLHQSILKNVFGFYKDLVQAKFESFSERAMVYAGKQKDPFNQYNWLQDLHEQYQLNPIYFFLVANKRKGVDKNISPSKKAMRQLIQTIGKKYLVGIHPSWQSGNDTTILKNEINNLSSILNAPVQSSRQHFLRMQLPSTYQQLIALGITKEYSMGYGSINGFRASYANAYFWYDLKNESKTILEIHPFCYMDATAIFKLGYAPYEAKKELQDFYKIIQSVNGNMICIFHNNFLTDQVALYEWKKMYASFLADCFQTPVYQINA